MCTKKFVVLTLLGLITHTSAADTDKVNFQIFEIDSPLQDI